MLAASMCGLLALPTVPTVPAVPTVPTVRIATSANGVPIDMPLVGIGTWQYNSSVAKAAVKMAVVDKGYRHIDTAIGYKNQDGVGEAIAEAVAAGIPRNSLFVVSKIPGGLNQTAATQQLDTSLSQLFPGDDDAYVDLMLVHFPATWGGEGGKAARQAEWRALEAFARAGKARAIGVSHYCRRHIEDLLDECS